VPIHDWSRVDEGIIHDFTLGWFVHISQHFNTGGLPQTHYSLVESYHSFDIVGVPKELPPQVFQSSYAAKQKTITVRGAKNDNLVAMLEIVIPATRAKKDHLREFVEKAKRALDRGINLVLVDIFPPAASHPQGIHVLIWGESVSAAPDQPLTMAAYHAMQPRQAYLEPTAVGRPLFDMPLFLDDAHYVPVPLEATYQAAWRGVPQRWKTVLEGPTAT
jgi:hypothetical protein